MAWDWGSIATAAMQAVGQMSSNSASSTQSREQAREQWAAQLEQMRMNIAGQRDLVSQTRGYQLQDRAWNREQVDGYRQFYTGTPSEQPKPISTEVVNTPQTAGLALTTSAAKPTTETKPPKKPKKPSTLRRLLGGGIF